MAKIRRIIRKLPAPEQKAFDEQLWPVNVALLVLASFLVGMTLAYRRFDDPVWYANAATWLVGIAVFTAFTMLALRFVKSRTLNRVVQLATILSILAHVIFLIFALESTIFATRNKDVAAKPQLVDKPPPVTIPEYAQHHFADPQTRPKQDFEKPVETETPDPPAEEVARQETQPEPPQREPQPTPVPDPQPTREPNLVKKAQTGETSPRASEQASQLSRRTATSAVRPNQTADVPKPSTAQAQPTPQPQPTVERPDTPPVVRRETTAQPNRPAPTAEPATPVERPTSAVARRTVEPTATPETSATPTLQRAVAQPRVAPRAAVTAPDSPSVARQTTPDATKPTTSVTTRQDVTTPQIARQQAEPSPQPPTPTTAPTPQRALPSPTEPTLAATPTPVPNQRTRTTPRPQTATTSPNADATPTPLAGQPNQPTAQATPIARATTAAVRAPTPSPVAPATTAAATPAASSNTRRETTETPTPTTAPTEAPAVARQVGRANPVPSAQPTAGPAVAAAQQTQPSESLAPAQLVTRRQATASPQVARATGDPTPARTPNSSPAATASTANRQTAAADSPNPSPNATPSPPNPTRQTGPAVANVVTRAAPVASNMAPRASSELQPSASSSQVARQTAGSPAATRVQNPQETQAASSSNQVAQANTQRTQVAPQPSIDPSAPVRTSPARSLQAAATAASPTNIESPAMSVAAQGAGEPAAQPTRTALSKSQTGLTGAGASTNLDRSSPAPTSPALAASGSAQRAEATQATPEGAAFSPSMTAAVPRAVAGQARPSATLQAADVPVATAAGAAQPTELNASSSAALAQANSDASPGVVTADAGRVDVDLGPTRVVSESGSGRSSGGGQPDVNFAPESRLVARSREGGSPQMAIASTQAAAAPVAPMGDSGGSPAATPTDAVATARSQSGGAEPVTGGPSAAANPGPTTEVSAAPLVAESSVSRADSAAGAPDAGAAGPAPSTLNEDEEEKARRLARSAAGGGPQLPVTGPVPVDAPVAAAAQGGGGPTSELQASTFAAAMSRSGPSGMLGGPTGAPQTGPMAEAASGSSPGELVAQSVVSRAEAVDAASGEPALGGGASAPGRTAAGPTFQADAQAQTVELAGGAPSSGSPQGAPLEAQGIEAARVGGGVRGTPVDGPAGASEAQVAQDAPSVGLIGGAPGRRQTTSGTSDAPEASAADSGGPLRRSDAVAAGATPGTAVNVADLPAEVQQALVDHLAGGAATSAMKRDASGGPLSVDIAAVEGPGGLGSQATPDVGVLNRRASSESLDVQVRTARFQRQNVGGLPNISTAAVASTDPFRQRASRGSNQGAGNGSPPPQTEEAIELGLAFLARYQSPDGSWTLGGFQDEVALSSDTAATGLALLAFQGAGYNHREHKYQEIVRAGLDHLVKNQKDDGDLFVPMDDNSNRSVWLYSHSIAALSLCEAYGMTQDPALKEPAQKALNFIVAAQQPQRGGWRYAPGVGADTSVSGWMMMALKSGELAGLKVPQDTYVGVQKWLDGAQVSVSQRHQYRYNPQAPDTDTQRHGRQATRTMTAVGLLMRMYLGWRRDNADVVRGADYLLEALPAYGTARNNERDTYYWYYATQVMFHVGGARWEQWNSRLHPLLVQSQVKQGPFAGSWDPRTPVPDRWAFHAGRLYVTAMNLLSLEVYYRHLPLYDETAR